MSDEYTPTTDEVREEFIYGHQELDMDGNVVVSFDETQARWDRWLAGVERAAAEKAWARCVGEMPIDLDWKNFYSDNNPYRKGTGR